jgi:2-methylcitrate dehydratase PrpD
MSFAKQLAEKIVALDESRLDDDLLLEIKRGLVDVVGVSLAGSLENCAKLAMISLGGSSSGDSGPAQVIGQNLRAATLDAALINGTIAHALDFDDVNILMGGHPSAPAFAAAAALADEVDASGTETMLAFLAAYETTVRMGPGLHPHHYNKGWHPTATFGTFGAAAAGAKLLKLDVEQTAIALGIACSMASGIKSNFGTMVKPLHVGQSARNGLFAAVLASNGFDASPEAFEHKQGFFEVFNGAGTYDADKIVDLWGAPFSIMDPGLAIKIHPCCGSTHTAVDAMLKLREDHGLVPEMVEKIESSTYLHRLAHTDRPNPASDLDGKFSVQYCMARALMHGVVKMEHFENGAVHDADARALLAKVTSTPHEKDNIFHATVAVTTKAGERFEQAFEMANGRCDNPVPQEQLKLKFESTSSRALTTDRVAQLYETIMSLENLPSVHQMTDLLAAEGASAEQAAE